MSLILFFFDLTETTNAAELIVEPEALAMHDGNDLAISDVHEGCFDSLFICQSSILMYIPF